jgi:PmbA protein
MDYRELAASLLGEAKKHGADDADTLIAEGTEFSVSVRKGEIETLKESGSKALGLRVFVGRRTANAHTSDFSAPGLREFVASVVDMARATGADPAAGLPDATEPAEELDLGLYDAATMAVPTAERIEQARTAEAVALAVPGITNSHGGSYRSGEGYVLLANTRGFMGSYRSSSCSLSVVPIAEQNGVMERDYWYTYAHGPAGTLPPEEVGRIAAERTLRRLGARKVKTAQVPIVFDPETAAEILGALFDALSGYAVFRNSTFLRDQLGTQVASPLLTLVDEGRRPGGFGSRPWDGEGCATRRNVPIEKGVLRHYMCDWYASRKTGAAPNGCARRGVGGGPGVGSSNLYFEPGTSSPQELIAAVQDGFYVTDLFGFGVNLVSGDYSQGAAGLWIEKGELAYPVNEVTIAGNLKDMLRGIDGVGNDLLFRGASASPTLRVARMTVSGA